jgi:hypothetical protein
MTDEDDECSFCGEAQKARACQICLEAFSGHFRFESKSILLNPTCDFCSPLLPIPGTPPFRVLKLKGIAICETCVEKMLAWKASGRSATVLQFGPSEDSK